VPADDPSGSAHGRAGVGPWEVLAFACELAMLAALAVTGWGLSRSGAVRIVLAVLLPFAVAALWSRWLAPTSAHRLTGATLMAVKVALFALSGVGLAAVGHPGWGGLLVLVAVGDLFAIQVSAPPSTAR